MTLRTVVVDWNPTRAEPAVVPQLRALGWTVDVLRSFDAIDHGAVIDHDAVRDIVIEPKAPIRTDELIQLRAHRAAWRQIDQTSRRMTLIVDGSARLNAGFARVVDEVVIDDDQRDGRDAYLVALGDPLWLAYIVNQSGARRLHEMLVTSRSFDTAMAIDGLSIAFVDPPGIELDHEALPPPGPWLTAPIPLHVGVAHPSTTVHVVGTPTELAVGYAEFDADVVIADGAPDVWLGEPAGEGARVGEASSDGDDVSVTNASEIDLEHRVFAVLDEHTMPVLSIIGDRVIDVAHDTQPLVVIDPEHRLEAWRGRARLESASDLARVLRYDGAAVDDDALVVREVSNEILTIPLWTPEFCAALIRAAEMSRAWSSDPDDPVPGREISLAAISPRLYEHVERHLAERIVPRLRQHWPTIDDRGVHDAFVIKDAASGTTTSGSSGLRLHHDLAQWSGSVRLNDDYDGGELEFPRQLHSTRATDVGTLTVWPSLVTHPHGSAAVMRGVKYGLTIWWRLPGAPTDDRAHP